MKRFVYLLFSVFLGSSLYFSISNTWKWSSDFHGLVILVSVPDEERSYNPYSNGFFWVSQDMAVSIIKNLDYPYEQCAPVTKFGGGCQQPKIEYTGRLIGWVGVETKSKIFEILRFLIQRGEPIDAYSLEGYTALQSAILGNSPKLVSLLLEAGANPYLPINREGKLQGKNSVEFIEWLSSKNDENYSLLIESFYKQMPNKSSKKDALKRASS